MLVERLRLVGLDIVQTLKDKAEDILMTYCKFSGEESDSSGHEEGFDEEELECTLERIMATPANN